MMRITKIESFNLQVPVGEIADSKRTVDRIEFPGLWIETDAGIVGTGFACTVGRGGAVIQKVIDSLFAEDLVGQDATDISAIWERLYSGPALWIGRAGAAHMALAAVDIALWDIAGKAKNLPLWKCLGSTFADPFPAYNTHAGWLNFSVDRLCREALEQLDAGYTALKMKVGSDSLAEDLRRVAAVRQTIGPDILLMADANQKWDIATACSAAVDLGAFNLSWLEEPLHPDDIKGHAEIRSRAPMPIALGEHVYSTHMFGQFIDSRAVDVIQVDVCRVGGITPWLQVAAMAQEAGIRVCPHAGDVAQVHQHMVRAIPNNWLLETIPLWRDGPFLDQIRIESGMAIAPNTPGASTEFKASAIEQYRVS